MKITPKQMQAVLALPGPKLFEHFIKVVVDCEKVWGLYLEGWALSAADDGTIVFPMWPAKEYAEMCAVDEWNGFEARAVELSEFVDVLLPKLKAENILPGVFITPADKGLTPSEDELKLAIESEMTRY